jgi:hypothetical protein
MKNDALSKLVEAIIYGGIGLWVGQAANDWYFNLTPQEKAEYERKRILHHGELGILIRDYGIDMHDVKLESLGLSLIYSDIKDKDKWKIGPRHPLSL